MRALRQVFRVLNRARELLALGTPRANACGRSRAAPLAHSSAARGSSTASAAGYRSPRTGPQPPRRPRWPIARFPHLPVSDHGSFGDRPSPPGDRLEPRRHLQPDDRGERTESLGARHSSRRGTFTRAAKLSSTLIAGRDTRRPLAASVCDAPSQLGPAATRTQTQTLALCSSSPSRSREACQQEIGASDRLRCFPCR
jgi:hypothetical protein